MYKLELSLRIKHIENKFKDPIKKILYTLHWRDNLKHSEIGEKVGVPRSTVTKWFHRLGVPTQDSHRITRQNLLNVGSRKGPRAKPKIKKEFPWHFNKNFFGEWSDEMAYVLGFLIADGYVFTNPRGSNYFAFSSTDKGIIVKLRTILESNHKIGVKKRNEPNWKVSYVLQIGSKKVVNELKKFGIIQNKSLIISFPKNIPRKFLKHFVRGYFDGDGCVNFNFYYVKNRKQLKPAFATRFTSGSEEFLKSLFECLKKYTNIKGGCLLTKKERGYDLQFSVRDSFKLFKFMYGEVDEKQFLERKYNIFQEAIKYYGDVA